MLKLALFIRTLCPVSTLQIFFNQIWTLAIRANFFNRLTPCHKLAFRVFVAAVEILASLGTAFNNIAFFAQWAVHSNGVLLHVFAGRIVGTSNELPKSAELLHQLVVATRAFFF